MAKVADFSYDDLVVGQTVSFEAQPTDQDVQDFANVSSDTNPLHMDEDYASKTEFGKRVVHGMLLGSYISQLVGVHLPGKKCLLLSNDMKFKQPAFIDDKLIVDGKIIQKYDAMQAIKIQATIKRDHETLCSAEVMVKVV